MRRSSTLRLAGALLFLLGVFLPAILNNAAVAPAIGLIVIGALVVLGFWPVR